MLHDAQGILWSHSLEKQVPQGFSETQGAAYLEAASGAKVGALELRGRRCRSNQLPAHRGHRETKTLRFC